MIQSSQVSPLKSGQRLIPRISAFPAKQLDLKPVTFGANSDKCDKNNNDFTLSKRLAKRLAMATFVLFGVSSLTDSAISNFTKNWRPALYKEAQGYVGYNTLIKDYLDMPKSLRERYLDEVTIPALFANLQRTYTLIGQNTDTNSPKALDAVAIKLHESLMASPALTPEEKSRFKDLLKKNLNNTTDQQFKHEKFIKEFENIFIKPKIQDPQLRDARLKQIDQFFTQFFDYMKKTNQSERAVQYLTAAFLVLFYLSGPLREVKSKDKQGNRSDQTELSPVKIEIYIPFDFKKMMHKLFGMEIPPNRKKKQDKQEK